MSIRSRISSGYNYAKSAVSGAVQKVASTVGIKTTPKSTLPTMSNVSGSTPAQMVSRAQTNIPSGTTRAEAVTGTPNAQETINKARESFRSMAESGGNVTPTQGQAQAAFQNLANNPNINPLTKTSPNVIESARNILSRNTKVDTTAEKLNLQANVQNVPYTNVGKGTISRLNINQQIPEMNAFNPYLGSPTVALTSGGGNIPIARTDVPKSIQEIKSAREQGREVQTVSTLRRVSPELLHQLQGEVILKAKQQGYEEDMEKHINDKLSDVKEQFKGRQAELQEDINSGKIDVDTANQMLDRYKDNLQTQLKTDVQNYSNKWIETKSGLTTNEKKLLDSAAHKEMAGRFLSEVPMLVFSVAALGAVGEISPTVALANEFISKPAIAIGAVSSGATSTAMAIRGDVTGALQNAIYFGGSLGAAYVGARVGSGIVNPRLSPNEIIRVQDMLRNPDLFTVKNTEIISRESQIKNLRLGNEYEVVRQDILNKGESYAKVRLDVNPRSVSAEDYKLLNKAFPDRRMEILVNTRTLQTNEGIPGVSTQAVGEVSLKPGYKEFTDKIVSRGVGQVNLETGEVITREITANIPLNEPGQIKVIGTETITKGNVKLQTQSDMLGIENIGKPTGKIYKTIVARSETFKLGELPLKSELIDMSNIPKQGVVSYEIINRPVNAENIRELLNFQRGAKLGESVSVSIEKLSKTKMKDIFSQKESNLGADILLQETTLTKIAENQFKGSGYSEFLPTLEPQIKTKKVPIKTSKKKEKLFEEPLKQQEQQEIKINKVTEKLNQNQILTQKSTQESLLKGEKLGGIKEGVKSSLERQSKNIKYKEDIDYLLTGAGPVTLGNLNIPVIKPVEMNIQENKLNTLNLLKPQQLQNIKLQEQQIPKLKEQQLTQMQEFNFNTNIPDLNVPDLVLPPYPNSLPGGGGGGIGMRARSYPKRKTPGYAATLNEAVFGTETKKVTMKELERLASSEFTGLESRQVLELVSEKKPKKKK